ncbi:MAG: DUF4112 domain-containing protein [Planctomycetota bacterium]
MVSPEVAGKSVRPWVPRLARLMDSLFRVPGTKIRFGLDTLLGSVPIVGDTLTLVVGLGMVVEALRLRAPIGLVGRMVWNLIVDWVAGLIPGIDLVLDTMVKAHMKNAKLLDEHAAAIDRAE